MLQKEDERGRILKGWQNIPPSPSIFSAENKECFLMNHIVVLFFTGIHNIAVHNLRKGQGVHKCFEMGKCKQFSNII